MTCFQEDSALIAALKKSDHKAYEHIYETYFVKLCKYVFVLSRDMKKAEDIVQNCLLKLWANRNKVNIDSSLKSYLYRMVYFAYVDEYRKEKRRKSWIDALHRETIVEIEQQDQSLHEKRLQKLFKLIDSLPERRREILILSKLKNHKYSEIAVKLGISKRTVESQIRKALIFIREGMGNPQP